MYFFEEKVKYLVRVRNMTMKDFAERMGMQRAAVYELIKRPVIRPEIVAKVCHILNIDKTFFEIKEKYPVLDNMSAVMVQEKAPGQQWPGFLLGNLGKLGKKSRPAKPLTDLPTY